VIITIAVVGAVEVAVAVAVEVVGGVFTIELLKLLLRMTMKEKNGKRRRRTGKKDTLGEAM